MKLEGDSLPLAVRDSEERLSKGGAYLLETGLHLFLWVGANAQQELLLNIFGTPSFGQIDPNLVRGPQTQNGFSVGAVMAMRVERLGLIMGFEWACLLHGLPWINARIS